MALDGGDGVGAGVDAVHRGGPAGRGVDGEPTGAAEHVEHPGPGGQRSDPGPVVALVEEVSRLLTTGQVGLERQPVLEERDRTVERRSGENRPVGERGRHRRGGSPGRSAHAQHHALLDRVGDVGQRGEDRLEVGQPGRGVESYHPVVAVAVDHQARQAVVLTVHAAIGGGGGRVGELAAKLDRRQQALPPEVGVDRSWITVMKDPDPDGGRRVVEADGHEAPLVVEHDGEITAGPAVAGAGHRGVVDPGVAAPDLAAGVGGHSKRHPTRTGVGEIGGHPAA